MVTRFVKNGVLYSFHLEEDRVKMEWVNYLLLVVTSPDDEKIYKIPVRDCDGFRIKINKKSCSAAGGARGLFGFVRDCIQSDFMMD